jgi:hypothetical protein
MGEFRIGLTRSNIDFRITQRGEQPAVEWTWEGMDEMEPCTGRGREAGAQLNLQPCREATGAA